MTIGEKIKYLRIKNNLLQEDLAKAVNSTKQAIYKYENGIVTNIPMDKIEMMAVALNVSPAYLMGWDTNNKSPPGEKEKTLDINVEDLSPAKLQLIQAVRNLPDEQAASLLQLLEAFLANDSKQ